MYFTKFVVSKKRQIIGSNQVTHAGKGKGKKAEFRNNDKRLSCMNVDYGQSVIFAKL